MLTHLAIQSQLPRMYNPPEMQHTRHGMDQDSRKPAASNLCTRRLSLPRSASPQLAIRSLQLGRHALRPSCLPSAQPVYPALLPLSLQLESGAPLVLPLSPANTIYSYPADPDRHVLIPESQITIPVSPADMADSKVQEQVQKILDDACAEENGVPGIVFGMMDRKGNYLAKAAAGVRGLNRKDEKMTTDTAFAIYSCTKVG